MRVARLTALVLVALGLALVAAGCGEEEGPQIPRDEAAELISRLREADRRVSQDPPVCGDLSEQSLPTLERLVANLPEDTDEGIRETLEDGVDHLRSLVEAECAARDEEPEETTTTEETTTEEEPPPETQTTPPETQTTPPETQTTPPETDPPPPDNPGNPGGGQGVPEGAVQPKLKRKKDKD